MLVVALPLDKRGKERKEEEGKRIRELRERSEKKDGENEMAGCGLMKVAFSAVSKNSKILADEKLMFV